MRRISQWRGDLLHKIPDPFTIELDGSLASGLCGGAISPRYSYAQDLPSDCGLLQEIDLNLILPADKNPHDRELASRISDTLGFRCGQFVEHQYWGRRTPVAALFKEESLGEGVCRQWQLNIVNQPFLTLAPYFRTVFSPDEADWMKFVREYCRDALQVSSEEYFELKGLQCLECRWRVVASYALSREDPSADVPVKGTAPELIQPIIDAWRGGRYGGEGLDRPAVTLPATVIRAIRLSRPALLTAPHPPAWAEKASKIQWERFALNRKNKT